MNTLANRPTDGKAIPYFWLLSRPEQIATVQRLARQGFTDETIASICRFSINDIRRMMVSE